MLRGWGAKKSSWGGKYVQGTLYTCVVRSQYNPFYNECMLLSI
jgi:hypothetical protein